MSSRWPRRIPRGDRSVDVPTEHVPGRAVAREKFVTCLDRVTTDPRLGR